MRYQNLKYSILLCSITFCILHFALPCRAEDIKQPVVSGRFYPANPKDLSRVIEGYLSEVELPDIKGNILVMLSPHAGYEFSGGTAAYGYKTIKGRHYDTVLILGPSHYVDFKGAALWPKGAFRTPLGDIPVDESLAYSLMLSSPIISVYPEAFAREHAIEVQLPFLQKALDDFKIVPVLIRNVDFSDCQNLAKAIIGVIQDKNCLIVASSDMYHGFNYQDAELLDIYTLSLIRQLKAEKLYEDVQGQRAQLCGWAAVITSMLIAKELGYSKVEVLSYANSAEVMNKKQTGEYCVGYGSVVMYKKDNPVGNPNPENNTAMVFDVVGPEEEAMLNQAQRKELLGIARKSIEHYLSTGKKLELAQPGDSILSEQYGAFVTLHKHNQLRGCIGNLVGQQPLYLTIRDMAIEAAVGDPRFTPMTKDELPEVEIEISVLSPLKKVDNPEMIELGKHGVLVKKGYQSGVFLPQVATETGWSREEFLSNLCAHKAGLSPSAWKESSTEVYVFTAEVFSE